MGTLWKIAFRNVLRNKRRTAITGIVMCFGIGMFIAMDSMLVGMDRITIDNIAAYTDSFMLVRTPEYASNVTGTPLEHGIPDPEGAAARILSSDARVAAVTPRTPFVARLSNYETEIPVRAVAVDPARDAEVYALAGDVAEGSWFGGDAAKTVVMGRVLAQDLGFELGDSVMISASTAYENVNADEYRIVGILDTPVPEINKTGLYMAYADADGLLGTKGLVTQLATASGKYGTLDGLLSGSAGVAASVRAALPALQADDLSSLAQDYLAMRQMKGKFSYVLILSMLLIAGVGIVNTILMAVYARVREIGVLKAYGMHPKDIRRLFTIEGVIVGFAGSLAGVILGALFDWYLVAGGVPLSAFFGDMSMGSIPFTGTLYGVWNPATMVSGFVFGLVVAFVSARIPAKRAARLEATDALKFA